MVRVLPARAIRAPTESVSQAPVALPRHFAKPSASPELTWTRMPPLLWSSGAAAESRAHSGALDDVGRRKAPFALLWRRRGVARGSRLRLRAGKPRIRSGRGDTITPMSAQHSQRAACCRSYSCDFSRLHHCYLAKPAELEQTSLSTLIRVLLKNMCAAASELDTEDSGEDPPRPEIVDIWLGEPAVGEEDESFIAFVQRPAHESHALRPGRA
jgi:hypothetical protein